MPGKTIQGTPALPLPAAVRNDRRLVKGCLAGDAQAIRSFVEEYQGAVFGLCYRMTRHRQDAEDVTQEVLLRAIRSLKSWDQQRPLRPWILAIAVNRCRSYLVQQSRRPRLTDYLPDLPDPRGSEQDHGLSDEIELALTELRPDYRMVVIMYHDQELPYEEISAAMGRPIGTVKTWLHRARAELARYLTRHAVGQAARLPPQP